MIKYTFEVLSKKLPDGSEVITYSNTDGMIFKHCLTKEHCYAEAIRLELPYGIDPDDRSLYQLPLAELKKLAASMGIQIEFTQETL